MSYLNMHEILWVLITGTSWFLNSYKLILPWIVTKSCYKSKLYVLRGSKSSYNKSKWNLNLKLIFQMHAERHYIFLTTFWDYLGYVSHYACTYKGILYFINQIIWLNREWSETKLINGGQKPKWDLVKYLKFKKCSGPKPILPCKVPNLATT